MYAIYARQSIDKKDSISIDTQIHHCMPFCSSDYRVYKDPGYSGADINRPDFQRLLQDIKSGKVRKVIIYRLDRISRSLTDFARLIELFEEHNVSFLSATEQFDTSTAFGRAMVYIIMVFAQLERETIASRIRDNYFARAEKGMFLGGNCPYGYKSIRTEVNGKESSVLDSDLDASTTIKEIFKQYAYGASSLYNIAMSIPGKWTANKVRRILKNPVYVANGPEIYEYFKQQGYNIANDLEDFNGENGCMLIGKEKGKKNRKYNDISDQSLIIGLHKPLIDANTFILAQRKLFKNKSTKRSGTSQYTWLTGLVKCQACKHSISVKRVVRNNKEYLHLICRGRTNYGPETCANKKFYRLSEYESAIESELLKTISSLDYSDIRDTNNNPDTIRIKAEIIDIDGKIDNLLNQMADGVVGDYIQKKIQDFDMKKRRLQEQLSASETCYHNNELMNLKNNIHENWKNADIRERHRIADIVIDKIYLHPDGTISIDWKV